MPVFRLVDEPLFPAPELAEPDGLLAVGGDLSPVRLLTAYAQGIFPWYAEGEPVLWWSPDPRMVLHIDEFRVSRSLRKTLAQAAASTRLELWLDRDFEAVMRACAGPSAASASSSRAAIPASSVASRSSAACASW